MKFGVAAQVLLTTLAAGPAAHAGDFRRGEINGDGRVELTDAVIILEFLFLGASPPACLDAADSNDDGEISLTDGVYLLGYLFLGSEAPPPPSPGARCPGPDPTADPLDCAGGSEPVTHRPSLTLRPVFANAPGIRERSRRALGRDPDSGRYLAPAGTSLTIVAEATSNPLSQATLSLQSDDGAGATPDNLRVVCDRPLGDPSTDGVAAGTNLAPYFLDGLDLWSDPIYLVTDAALRIHASGPLAPQPGVYRFTATVADDGCGVSEAADFELEVFASNVPDLVAWVERVDEPDTGVSPHDPATGNPRVAPDEAFTLVIEARPNRLSDAPPDPNTLTVMAQPPQGGPQKLVAEEDPDALPDGFRWRLPMQSLPHEPGDMHLTVAIATDAASAAHSIPFIVEIAVGFEEHVRPILMVNCTGCHEQPDPEKGLELVAPGEPGLAIWRNIVNVFATQPRITSSAPILVRPLFPERSYLFHKLRGSHLDDAVEGEGERMPLDAVNYLPPGDLWLLRSWISQGAGRP